MEEEDPSSVSASSQGHRSSTNTDGHDDVSGVAIHDKIEASAITTMTSLTPRGEPLSQAAVPSPAGLFVATLRKYLNPRAADIRQLLVKLQTQFKMLEVQHKKYILLRTGSSEKTNNFYRSYASIIVFRIHLNSFAVN